MNDDVKRRLVGGLTLFVLGVIFIPLILDGPPPGRFDDGIEVTAPRAEDDDVVTFKPPTRPAKVSLTDPVRQSSAPVIKPKPVVPQKAKIKSVPVKATGGWIVQVGSFGSRSNATGLLKRLKAKGFDAHMDSASGNKGPVYRVYVGPVASKEKAQRTRSSINALFGMKGLVKKNG